jgi:hypothetical protein
MQIQMLLLLSIDGPFEVVILTPLKACFYHGFGH